jgi:hypothetical protein
VYISFLSHEYTDDGVHMTLDFPAAGGVSPPIVIRYGEMPQSVAVEPDCAAAIAGGGGGEDNELRSRRMCLTHPRFFYIHPRKKSAWMILPPYRYIGVIHILK